MTSLVTFLKKNSVAFLAGVKETCHQVFWKSCIQRVCNVVVLSLLLKPLRFCNNIESSKLLYLKLAKCLFIIGNIGHKMAHVLMIPYVMLGELAMFISGNSGWILFKFVASWNMNNHVSPFELSYSKFFRQERKVVVFAAVTILSVVEEILFRGLFNWPLWLYQKCLDSNKRHANKKDYPFDYSLLKKEKEERDLRKWKQRWVLCKGFCFGALHVLNWIRPGIEHVNIAELVDALYGAIAQSILSFLASVLELDPIAAKHGLAGSIGAHLSHNVISVALPMLLRKIQKDCGG